MSIAKIVTSVTGTPRDEVAIRTAFAAAKPFNAHVRVLFLHPDPRLSVPYVGVPVSPDVVQSIINANEEMLKAASKAARVALATAADEANVRIVGGVERAETVTASFVEKAGYFGDCLEKSSLLADLVVFPPLGHGDNPEAHDGFVRVLTRAGRPVLLAPEEAPRELGRKIALAWDGGVVAAHALSAALPFLSRATAVQLISVHRPGARGSHVEDAKSYLKLHGILCTATTIDPAGRTVGDVLMEAACTDKCDLLVMGGYGHNRLAETVFGGVTERISSHTKLSVFMAH